MKENFFSMKRRYADCAAYLKESKPFIKIAMAIFALTFLIGFIFPVFFVEEISSFIEEMISSLEGLSGPQIISFIFLNNLQASFFAMIAGLGLAILPVTVAVVNGYLLGFVSKAAIQSEGIFILWRLLPHGIFELPAIFLSIGIGIKLGTDLFKKTKKRSTKENIIQAIWFFALVILPLLVLAAIIEGALISITG